MAVPELGSFAGPLFLAAFVVMWLGVCYLLSFLGGWQQIAKIYPAHEAPVGRRFHMQSGMVGLVSYGGCLTVCSSDDGLYLSVGLPFRVGHRPLFFPWEAINVRRVQRILWREDVEFYVGSPVIATLKLPKKFFEGHVCIDATS